MKKYFVFIIFLMTSITANAHVATEYTQWLNHKLLDKSLSQQIAQLKVLEKELRNLQLNNLPLTTQNYSAVSQHLNQLASIAKQNQALAYSTANLNQQFKRLYPGTIGINQYKVDDKQWSATTLDTLEGSMSAANLQASQFEQEAQLLNQLKLASNTNQGRLQALQVGHQIALEQIAQMQKLRQLLMSQIQAQNVYLATQAQRDARRRAGVDQLFLK